MYSIECILVIHQLILLLFFNGGGHVFAKPMREKKYVTLLDPFQFKYGKVLTVGMSLVTVTLDLLFLPETLIGLGTWFN